MAGAIHVERSDRLTLIAAGSAAIGIGLLAAATSPLVPLAVLAGAGVLIAIWLRPWLGLALFVALVATLPFGVVPVALAGAQLTFVDAILIATFSAVLARVLFVRQRPVLGPPGLALLAFALIATAALVVGGAISPTPPELIRRFGKLIASLLFYAIAATLLTSAVRLDWLVRWLVWAGAVQGAIGTSLMALAPPTQLALLTRLSVIGYPTTDVLRYVPGPNDTYTTQLRAIGTSVDPNVFGGTLMLALALAVVQWASPRPVMGRGWLIVLAIPIASGVLLSLSRASWLGLAAGLLLIGVLSYRRILVLGLVAGVALLVTPVGQDFVARFVSGFSAADRATAFRFGEYANAFTLLQRYPLLGIGFGLSPDIDVSAGVSSVYLLVAEQTGLLGLAAYLVALGTTWSIGVRGLASVSDRRLHGVRAALLAAFSSALVAGLLDHYFANLAFPHAVALFWLYAAGLVSAARLSCVPAAQREPERASKAGPATLSAYRTPV